MRSYTGEVGSIGRGAIILTVANIVSQLLGFVYRMALGRLIGPEGMGLFQLIFPFYSLSLALAQSGLCVAVSRLAAEYQALGNYRALRGLVGRALALFVAVFALISAAAFLFCNGIATRFLGDERTRLAVYALVPVIFFTGIENIHKNFMYGTGRTAYPAISDVVEQIVRIGAVLGLLYLLLPRPDTEMLAIIVCGMLVCEIVSSSFLRFAYRRTTKHLPQGGAGDSGMTHRILKTAMPVSAAQLVNNLLSSLIVVIIPRRLVAAGLTQSQALGEFGVMFGMAMPLLNLPSALIVGLSVVMVPQLSENLATGNRAEVQHKISRAIMTTSFMILPALAVMAPLGAELGWLLFGQAIEADVLPSLAVGIALTMFMVVSGSIMNGLGKQTRNAIHFIIGNAVELAMVFVLVAIPGVGMYGYVAALIVSALITLVLNMRVILRLSGLSCHWRRWFINPTVSALLAGLFARLVYLHLGNFIDSGVAALLGLVSALGLYLAVSSCFGVKLRRRGDRVTRSLT